jgi:GxxExxY protein
MIDYNRLKSHIFDVIGALFEVHKELGPGLNEYCYQEGLKLQLEEQEIPFKRELIIHPTYHGKPLEAVYRVDFLCKDDIIVELKAVTELNANHRAQLFNYMRLLNKPCGVLVNFLPKFADIQRYFYDNESKNILAVDGHIIKNYRDI